MADRAIGRPTAASGLKDFIVLGVRALASGLVVAVTLGFAALVLAHNAQAAGAQSDAATDSRALYAGEPVAAAAAAPAFRETLLVSARRDDEPWSAAPAPDGPNRPPRAGALWAKRNAQADNAGTLLLLLGLVAVGAVCLVAVIGRGARGTRT